MKKLQKTLSIMMAVAMIATPAAMLNVSAAETNGSVMTENAQNEINLDKSRLSTLEKEAAALQQNLYTEESYSGITLGMMNAYDALYVTSSQAYIDYSTEFFEKAMANLVLKENNDIQQLVNKYYETNYADQLLVEQPLMYTKPLDVKIDGYYLEHSEFNWCEPAINTFKINGYTFQQYNFYYPSSLEYLAVNVDTGEVIPLETALKDGKINADEFFAYYNQYKSFGFKMAVNYDVDNDGAFSINDVTAMQRILAGEYDSSATINGFINTNFVFDADGNNNLDISDATVLQRKLTE